MNDTIRIAAAPDRNVIPVLFALLNSVLISEKERDVEFYILESGLTDEDKASLKSFFETDGTKKMTFLHVEPDRVSEEIPITDRWPQEIYYRMLLPELVPGDVDRVLYLDTDMIVNKDISDFFFQDFEGKLLIAAEDPVFDWTLNTGKANEVPRNDFFRNLRDNEGMRYFCSGMLLLNIAPLREDYSFEKYMDILREIKEKTILFDQDLLNYVHKDDVKYADGNVYGVFTWDSHNKGRTYEDIRDNAAIVHFTAQAKPWTYNLTRYDIEQLWWDYAKGTPFYYDLMEKVFFQSLHSTYVEEEFNKLKAQNDELRGLLDQAMGMLKKFMPQ